MKIFKTAILLIVLIMGIASCKKKSDLIQKPSELIIGAYIRLDSTISNEFNFAAISTSTVSWMVTGIGEPIDKIISYVSTTNRPDKTTWKKIKEFPVSNNKATITISGSELATALGIAPTALKPGNQYTIFNEMVTKSGKLYSAINTNADLQNSSDYKNAINLKGTITCPFVAAGFAGDFAVVSDDNWGDFSPGDILQVTQATDTSVTLLEYPSPAYGTNRQPVIIKINPANGRATINPLQYVGNYGSTSTKVSTSKTIPSYIFSCTGDVILYQDVLYGSTTYGNQLLQLKKL